MAQQQNEAWANVLVSRVVGVLTDRPPESWTVTISRKYTPAIIEMLKRGGTATLEHLTTDPRETSAQLPCVPLYIKHANNSESLLPEADTPLQPGDQLLFCGRQGAEKHMRWTAHDLHAMSDICSGDDCPSGILWRWLANRRGVTGRCPDPEA
jgi:hypothetical protein